MQLNGPSVSLSYLCNITIYNLGHFITRQLFPFTDCLRGGRVLLEKVITTQLVK